MWLIWWSAMLDIIMPEMNGLEAACQIRQFVPSPKIVLICSHYTPDEGAILARLYGDGDFIPKSEAGKALILAVSRLARLKQPFCRMEDKMLIRISAMNYSR